MVLDGLCDVQLRWIVTFLLRPSSKRPGAGWSLVLKRNLSLSSSTSGCEPSSADARKNSTSDEEEVDSFGNTEIVSRVVFRENLETSHQGVTHKTPPRASRQPGTTIRSPESVLANTCQTVWLLFIISGLKDLIFSSFGNCEDTEVPLYPLAQEAVDETCRSWSKDHPPFYQKYGSYNSWYTSYYIGSKGEDHIPA